MADRVYLHIGQPKTGTTYLQQVLWANREALLEQGVLLPGRGHREHLWAALASQGRDKLWRRHPDAPGTWGRFAEELAAWPGTGLVSHEFFCGAGRPQVARILASLAPAEVHLVITARDALSMLTAGWQELVKNGSTLRPHEVPDRGAGPGSEFSWRTWDLRGVLRRWTDHLPPERVHVLTLPPRGSAPGQHWRNFAATVGVRPDVTVPEQPANQSLGVVQVELLRRVNGSLEGFGNPTDRGTWIRGQLAERWLAAQEGDRVVMGEALVQECRVRSRRAVATIQRRGFDVVGDLTSLLVPEETPRGRSIDEVSDDELIAGFSDLVAVMLGEVRDTSRELSEVRKALRSQQSDDSAS